MTAVPPLPADDLAILRFAGEWWADAAAKEQAMRERFGLEPVRFYQRVAVLVFEPAAVAAEPLICGRLRRIQERRARLRTRSTVMRTGR